MVEGLAVDVKSDELKKILRERLEHHQKKVEVYTAKATELKTVLGKLDADLDVGKAYSGGVSIDQKIREHQDQANYYAFMLDHVITDDVYRLGQGDLQRLGISVRHPGY